jgi:hypothetical protein
MCTTKHTLQENSTAGGNSTAPPSGSNSGRIMIQAEFAVINQTLAAIEDDVLTLSLAGGFESRHPISFTVVMPAATQLRYVANYGSGTVVLGPGGFECSKGLHDAGNDCVATATGGLIVCMTAHLTADDALQRGSHVVLQHSLTKGCLQLASQQTC